jgi:hypothetical protein
MAGRQRCGQLAYPVLRKPAAMPLIEMCMPRCTRSSAFAFAVAAHQFDLQVVQRVDIGKAVANGALQGGVVGQTVAVPGDDGPGPVPWRATRLRWL